MILPPPISTLFPYTTLFRSFLPVSGRKIRVRDKALRNHPTHIVPPDSCFSVFAQKSDPRLIYSAPAPVPKVPDLLQDRKSTRMNSSHSQISYAVFCLKKKNK